VLVFCGDCGIGVKEGENAINCVKFNQHIDLADAGAHRECQYFTPPREEDGEQLSAMELLLLKEQEMGTMRLKGPI